MCLIEMLHGEYCDVSMASLLSQCTRCCWMGSLLCYENFTSSVINFQYINLVEIITHRTLKKNHFSHLHYQIVYKQVQIRPNGAH